MNQEIMKKLGFTEEVNMVNQGICPFCGRKVDVTSFRDDISLKEFRIGGLCQTCQDDFYGV